MGRIGNHDTQSDTQDDTQDVTQEDTLDEKIEKAIKDNLNINVTLISLWTLFLLKKILNNKIHDHLSDTIQ